MNAGLKVSSVVVLFFMAVSCATTPRKMSEKYNLNDELKVVNRVPPFMNPSWQYVDKQALILKSNRHDYYLIVLRRPIYGLSPVVLGLTPRIPIATGSIEESQRDLDKLKRSSLNILDCNSSLVVKGSGGEQYYVIEKIYKFDGREQKEKFKERLRNF